MSQDSKLIISVLISISIYLILRFIFKYVLRALLSNFHITENFNSEKDDKIHLCFFLFNVSISLKKKPFLRSIFKNDPTLEAVKIILIRLISISIIFLISFSLILLSLFDQNTESITKYFSIIFFLTNLVFGLFEFLNQDDLNQDGGNLKRLLFRYKNIILKGGSEYNEALSKFETKNYNEAGKILSDLILKVSDQEHVFYSMAIKSFVLSNNEVEVKRIIAIWLNKEDSIFIDYNLIANSFCSINDLENGLKYYKKALKEGLDELSACFNIGFIYNLTGKYEKALSIFEYLSNKKNNFTTEILAESSYSNLKLGNLELCNKYLQEAINIDPNNAHTIKNLSLNFWELGEKKQAIETFQNLKEINPSIFNIEKLQFLKGN